MTGFVRRESQRFPHPVSNSLNPSVHFGAPRKPLGALSAHIDPRHPLSPCRPETWAIRERDIALMSAAPGRERKREFLITCNRLSIRGSKGFLLGGI